MNILILIKNWIEIYKQPIAVLIFISGLIFETIAVLELLKENHLQAGIWHCLSALLMSWPLWQLTQTNYRTHAVMGSLLFFLLCLLIPVISGPSLLFSLIIGSYYAKPIKKKTTDSINPSELPDQLANQVNVVQLDSANMRMILETSQQVDLRISVVLATRHLADEQAIPILRIALLDPGDEVRLLAFSMVSRIEKSIYSLLNQNLGKVADDTLTPAGKAVILKNIVDAYWELSSLDLIQGNNRTHMLNLAISDLNEAINYSPNDGSLHFLLARIYLALKQFTKSKQSFDNAEKQGIPVESLAPYQAELAFASSHFCKIRQYLEKIEHKTSILKGIEKQWAPQSERKGVLQYQTAT